MVALSQNHDAVVWVTFNFQHYKAETIYEGGSAVPWAGPHEHSVMVYGFQGNSFLIWNPWDQADYGAAYIGRASVPMSVFDGAYSTYGDMAVILR